MPLLVIPQPIKIMTKKYDFHCLNIYTGIQYLKFNKTATEIKIVTAQPNFDLT